ncbi:MAG TPA: macrolide ABC transporter ATP-binding protein [Massilia sp.]|nr:macrolide ABC transporter ATP-binding protein [Massilia sp.]
MPGAASKALIDIRAVTKSYFSGSVETKVLFGVDLQVERGDFIAVMGQSGSGKSTLMNILGCLDQATGGDYFLDGENTLALSRAQLAEIRNRTIGFVFQSFNLIKRMSVAENVALPLIYAGVPRGRALAKAAVELERVGLAGFGKRTPNQLSGGQQQRLCIARGVAVKPDVLLLDEPTSALDPISTAKIEELISELKQDYTITIVTHNMQQAARCSDYTAYMYLGELVEFGETDQLFMNPARKETQDYITGRFG